MNRAEIENLITDASLDVDRLRAALKKQHDDDIKVRTVLCVDIFQYSQMPELKQYILPYLVDKMFLNTIRSIREKEPAFFTEELIESIVATRIDTGDGFYVFLENPMQAIVFLMIFNFQVAMLQTQNLFHTLMQICEDFFVRYSIATGEVYSYEGKQYGEAIIKAARIIALDKVNRCLVDKETYYWFFKNANGLESLRVENLQTISTYREGKVDTKKESVFFKRFLGQPNAIKQLISQKVGTIKSKEDSVDIFNIYIQYDVGIGPSQETSTMVVVSLGNLNMNGIGPG